MSNPADIEIDINQHEIDETEPMETAMDVKETKKTNPNNSTNSNDSTNSNNSTNSTNPTSSTKFDTSKRIGEKSQDKRPNNTTNKRSKYNIDPNRSHIMYTDIEMPQDFLRDLPKNVKYKVMKGTLEEITQDIKGDINDLKPKNMILGCFGRQVLQRSNQSVIEVVVDLVDMVDSEGIHNIAPTTNHFIPNKPESWDAVASYNCQMRIINIDRGQPPLTLHKCLMDREYVDHGPLVINGSMWIEYAKQEGLGENLSRQGLGKYKHFFMKAFEHQFEKQQRNPSVRDMGTPKPPPLAATKGYEDYPFMRQILKERKLLNLKGVYNKPIDPPKHHKQQDQHDKQTTPIKLRSRSVTKLKSRSVNNINQEDQEKQERPKTWYAENLQVTDSQGGAKRKVSLPSTSSDSGFINDSREGNFNEDQDKIDKIYRDNDYYKKKMDSLYIENEDLKESLNNILKAHDDFKKESDIFTEAYKALQQENKDLVEAAQEDKDKLKSALRKLEVTKEESKMKDERLKMLQAQYDFFKSLQNDVSGYLHDKHDKTDKKKKRK